MASSELGATTLSTVTSLKTPAGAGTSPVNFESRDSIPTLNSPVSLIGGDNGNTLLPSTFVGGTILPAPAEGPTVFMLMRWLDPDCGLTTYRTWIVQDTPDPTGIHYSGSKCGSTPISGAVVGATWTE
jgi:hypothetical protein